MTEPLPLSGYLHPEYALALAEFGTPIELPRSGGWILRRPIPGTGWVDATGPYPFLVCRDWSALGADLDDLREDVVSIAATPDPFAEVSRGDLERAFRDRVLHFKDHHVADLSTPIEQFVSRHHLRSAEKALRRVRVEVCTTPVDHLDTWNRLFAMAVHHFGITGIRGFSPGVFARHFTLPGVVMTLAWEGDEVVAAHVQCVHGDAAYAHLAAAGPRARAVGAAYALYLEELRYFTGRVRWIDWGGSAGVGDTGGGLADFKHGWSTGTRPAYFAGRVLRPDLYSHLTEAVGATGTSYFPSYRAGEFT